MELQGTSKSIPDRTCILQAIDVVLSHCVASQMKSPDVVVGWEIQVLQNARAKVQQQWPLPDEVKAQINIGPVAAKNIADWNDELATSLMAIQHVLTHDGDSLCRLLGTPPS